MARDEFVEWEEVYQGTCYGTLKSEMERIWAKGPGRLAEQGHRRGLWALRRHDGSPFSGSGEILLHPQ